MSLRECTSYYDIIVKEGSINRIKDFITVNVYGEVTDSIETKSFSLIRACLYDGCVGYVLMHRDVISINKPPRCAF